MDQLWVVGISGGSVERGNLTPDREAFGDLGSPSGRAEQMPSGPKMCGDATECGQEPLGMAHRFKAFHRPFTLSGGLVRVLGSIVEVLRAAVDAHARRRRLDDANGLVGRADGVIFRAGALIGPDWRQAARSWTHSGGGLDVRQFTLTAGQVSLDSRRGSLAVGDDGALVGELDATLVEPGRLFAGLASENGETETQRLTFHGGSTWVGPARIAPAPRLF